MGSVTLKHTPKYIKHWFMNTVPCEYFWHLHSPAGASCCIERCISVTQMELPKVLTPSVHLLLITSLLSLLAVPLFLPEFRQGKL